MELVAEETKKHAVSEGYKRTEVGVIPEDWEMIQIKDLAHIGTGDKNTEDKIDDGKYPFYVRSSKVERINSYSFDGEAVLTAGDGVNTGKIFHYIDGKFDYHQRVYKISNFNKNIDGYYFYLVFSQYFYERVMGMTAKSSVDSVRIEMIADMRLPFPTLEEQLAIAEVLSDVDALIADLDALIEKKQQVKKGAMQQLLNGKKRLSGFDGEWEEKELGEITDVIMGSSPSSENYNQEGNGLPLIGGNADIKNRKSMIRVWSTQIPKKCDRGDVIMTVRAPVGTVAIASSESCLGRGVCSLEVNSIDKLFLYYQLMFNEPKWEALEQGSTFTSANSKQIEEFSIFVAEYKDEQKAIAQILSDMDAEIQALQAKRSKYEKIKQGMMQELLTGKTRLV